MSDEEVCCSNEPSPIGSENEAFNDDSENQQLTSADDERDEELAEDSEENEEDDEDEDNDCGIPRQRQKQIMTLLQQQNNELVEGDMWYLIDVGWYRKWKQYVKFDAWSSGNGSNPGPITNEGLLEEGTDRVPRSLLEHTHFSIISKVQWEHLHSWYRGGPAIPRPVIKATQYNKTVEIRLLDIAFIKSSAPDEIVRHEFSKVTTVGKMKEVMCPKLGVEPENIRIWDYHNKHRSQLLDQPEKTLSACTIIHNQFVLFEEKGEDGDWPVVAARTTPSYYNYSSGWNSHSTYGSSYSNQGKKPTDPGLCGLTNLGNTCFMNSSLQCLSNSPLLTRYCIGGSYKQDINKDNVLGTGGKLVEEYASLLRIMWSGEYQYYSPRNFKLKLQSFAPQFEGMQQHDSQELLAFLLDGLHEDLNRIKVKPYVELKEADGRPDDVVAEEAWQHHLARNDSVIVDWFHGQLKSKLKCPDCDRVSITFDPCMYLSLPMPIEKNRNIKVTMVQKDTTKLPVEYLLTVPKDGSIVDLKKALSQLSGVKEENMVVAELWQHKIYKLYTDRHSVDAIQDNDIIRVFYVESPEIRAKKNEDEESEEEEEIRPYAYYRPKPVPQNPDDIIHVQVILQKKEQSRSYYSHHSILSTFGEPIILAVRRAITYEDLHEQVSNQLRRFIGDNSVLALPPLPVSSKKDHMEIDDGSSKDASEDDVPETKNENPEEVDVKEEKEEEEEEEEDEKPMDVSEDNLAFRLQIVDSRGTKVTRDISRGDEVNFRPNEALSVLFSEKLLNSYKSEEETKTDRHDSMENEQEEKAEESLDLSTCLEIFTAEETLGPDDLWYCNKCKDHKQATKKFDLWKLPQLLVIHLKRFSYGNRYRREKLDTVVNFPLTGLDLSEHLLCGEKLPLYDLIAVSNHFGALGGGHYTAFSKNFNDGKWYKFDDSNVSPITEDKVCSSAAYVLFYQRRDTTIDEEKIKYEAPAEEDDDENTEDGAEREVTEDDEEEGEEDTENDGADNDAPPARTGATDTTPEDYESED